MRRNFTLSECQDKTILQKRDLSPFPIKASFPFAKASLPFAKVCLPFSKVSLPFSKASLPFAKACCPPAKAGWNVPATHQRDPTTAPRGQFELLPEGPGPVPGSLSHLVATGFPAAPMRTQRLVRTPALHGLARPVDPAHQRSNTRALQ